MDSVIVRRVDYNAKVLSWVQQTLEDPQATRKRRNSGTTSRTDLYPRLLKIFKEVANKNTGWATRRELLGKIGERFPGNCSIQGLNEALSAQEAIIVKRTTFQELLQMWVNDEDDIRSVQQYRLCGRLWATYDSADMFETGNVNCCDLIPTLERLAAEYAEVWLLVEQIKNCENATLHRSSFRNVVNKHWIQSQSGLPPPYVSRAKSPMSRAKRPLGPRERQRPGSPRRTPPKSIQSRQDMKTRLMQVYDAVDSEVEADTMSRIQGDEHDIAAIADWKGFVPTVKLKLKLQQVIRVNKDVKELCSLLDDLPSMYIDRHDFKNALRYWAGEITTWSPATSSMSPRDRSTSPPRGPSAFFYL